MSLETLPNQLPPFTVLKNASQRPGTISSPSPASSCSDFKLPELEPLDGSDAPDCEREGGTDSGIGGKPFNRWSAVKEIVRECAYKARYKVWVSADVRALFSTEHYGEGKGSDRWAWADALRAKALSAAYNLLCCCAPRPKFILYSHRLSRLHPGFNWLPSGSTNITDGEGSERGWSGESGGRLLAKL